MNLRTSLQHPVRIAAAVVTAGLLFAAGGAVASGSEGAPTDTTPTSRDVPVASAADADILWQYLGTLPKRSAPRPSSPSTQTYATRSRPSSQATWRPPTHARWTASTSSPTGSRRCSVPARVSSVGRAHRAGNRAANRNTTVRPRMTATAPGLEGHRRRALRERGQSTTSSARETYGSVPPNESSRAERPASPSSTATCRASRTSRAAPACSLLDAGSNEVAPRRASGRAGVRVDAKVIERSETGSTAIRGSRTAGGTSDDGCRGPARSCNLPMLCRGEIWPVQRVEREVTVGEATSGAYSAFQGSKRSTHLPAQHWPADPDEKVLPPERDRVEIGREGDEGPIAVSIDMPLPIDIRGIAIIGLGAVGKSARGGIDRRHLRLAHPRLTKSVEAHLPYRPGLETLRGLDDIRDGFIPQWQPRNVGDKAEDRLPRRCDACARCFLLSHSVSPVRVRSSSIPRGVPSLDTSRETLAHLSGRSGVARCSSQVTFKRGAPRRASDQRGSSWTFTGARVDLMRQSVTASTRVGLVSPA